MGLELPARPLLRLEFIKCKYFILKSVNQFCLHFVIHTFLKGIVHPEIEILSPFTHPHIVPNGFLSSVKHKRGYSICSKYNYFVLFSLLMCYVSKLNVWRLSAPLCTEEQEEDSQSPPKWPPAGYWCACYWPNCQKQTPWGWHEGLTSCSGTCAHSPAPCSSIGIC